MSKGDRITKVGGDNYGLISQGDIYAGPLQRRITNEQAVAFCLEAAVTDSSPRTAQVRGNDASAEAIQFGRDLLAMISATPGWRAIDFGYGPGTLPDVTTGLVLHTSNVRCDSVSRISKGLHAAGISHQIRQGPAGWDDDNFVRLAVGASG